MNNDTLLWLARMIGLVGLGLLVVSSIGGTLLASRTAQKIKWLKGKTFTYHRTTSLIGAALFLLHPIPLLLARETTRMNLVNVFVPFTAPLQTLWTSIGILAAYALIVVTVSSLYIKRMKRGTWRALHYGTYVVLALGLAHGLLISAEYGGEGGESTRVEQRRESHGVEAGSEAFDWEEPEKVVLLVMAGLTLTYPAWRVVAARRPRKTVASG